MPRSPAELTRDTFVKKPLPAFQLILMLLLVVGLIWFLTRTH